MKTVDKRSAVVEMCHRAWYPAPNGVYVQACVLVHQQPQPRWSSRERMQTLHIWGCRDCVCVLVEKLWYQVKGDSHIVLHQGGRKGDWLLFDFSIDWWQRVQGERHKRHLEMYPLPLCFLVLECLYTNAHGLGNKQEELELHVWSQNCKYHWNDWDTVGCSQGWTAAVINTSWLRKTARKDREGGHLCEGAQINGVLLWDRWQSGWELVSQDQRRGPLRVTLWWDFVSQQMIRVRKWLKPSLNLRKSLNHRPSFLGGNLISLTPAGSATWWEASSEDFWRVSVIISWWGMSQLEHYETKGSCWAASWTWASSVP